MSNALLKEVTFGDVTNLPDSSILQGFDFSHEQLTNSEYSRYIFNAPGYPDIVVRHHNYASPDVVSGFAIRQAQIGVEHFKIIADTGLVVPAQRIVVGPSRARPDNPEMHNLYSITARHDGEVLTSSPNSASHNERAINGWASYLARVATDETIDEYFFDIDTKQFTMPQAPEGEEIEEVTVWHDTGLKLESKYDSSNGIIASADFLTSWANESYLDEQPIMLRGLRDILKKQAIV